MLSLSVNTVLIDFSHDVGCILSGGLLCVPLLTSSATMSMCVIVTALAKQGNTPQLPASPVREQ